MTENHPLGHHLQLIAQFGVHKESSKSSSDWRQVHLYEMEVVQHQEQYRFGTNYKTTVKVTRVKLHLLDQSMSMIKVTTLLGSLHILCGSVVFVADSIANV